MIAAFHFIKFIIKLLLFIIFLPLILLWLLIRYLIYRAALIHNMVKSGMPKKAAKDFAKEVNPIKMFK